MSGLTLEQAKESLRFQFEKGGTCPCCNQFVKLYKRRVDSGMARTLIIVHQESRARPDVTWFPVNDLLKGRKISTAASCVALLKHWGLLQPKLDAKPDDGSKSAGLYRITSLGSAFALGATDIQKFVYLYNNKLVKRTNPDTTRTTIREALGKRFNYEELMGATPE